MFETVTDSQKEEEEQLGQGRLQVDTCYFYSVTLLGLVFPLEVCEDLFFGDCHRWTAQQK